MTDCEETDGDCNESQPLWYEDSDDRDFDDIDAGYSGPDLEDFAKLPF